MPVSPRCGLLDFHADLVPLMPRSCFCRMMVARTPRSLRRPAVARPCDGCGASRARRPAGGSGRSRYPSGLDFIVAFFGCSPPASSRFRYRCRAVFRDATLSHRPRRLRAALRLRFSHLRHRSRRCRHEQLGRADSNGCTSPTRNSTSSALRVSLVGLPGTSLRYAIHLGIDLDAEGRHGQAREPARKSGNDMPRIGQFVRVEHRLLDAALPRHGPYHERAAGLLCRATSP